MSDMRIDRRPLAMPDPLPDFDAFVVAGNVCPGLDASLRWLADALDGRQGRRPVVLVPGNVEFWDGRPKDESLRRCRILAEDLGITLLSDTALRVEDGNGSGVHFVGSTLWTDWALHGRKAATLARGYARHHHRDNGRIAVAEGVPYRPHDAAGAHARSRAFIEDVLLSIKVTAQGFGLSPTALVEDVRPGDRAVVVTHHAPSRASLCSRLSPDACEPWISAACASDVEDVMRMWAAPAAWIHGHVLSPADYAVGRCRVVANPRPRTIGTDTFDPAFVVEV
ncbi:phosphatase [Methylobacterium haplocladii]|uniref:Phosphatase n=2 Tax=Methylobacterium haplocladii TaxID=1176176 RepID=A0A512IJK5_9HYPH|nr:metallophosphoesterase [Methylobacterium haplocladii]GEO97874.1 phosphatase [Methylobacterium haplocladii]GLS57494.1 phosphatase [Methylobacterium haplocladii]